MSHYHYFNVYSEPPIEISPGTGDGALKGVWLSGLTVPGAEFKPAKPWGRGAKASRSLILSPPRRRSPTATIPV